MNKHLSNYNTCAIFVITGFTAILIWRCLYSFSWSDEPFYLSTVHRFYLGQSLGVDDWHPVTFYTVLLLPLYKLYMLVSGSNDGVILAGRIFYVTLSYAVSLLMFNTFKYKYGILPAACSALFYLLFSRANIMGISYYNLFATMFLAGSLLLFQYFSMPGTGLKDNLLLLFAGISWAIAVVCLPYSAAVYILGGILYIKK